MNQQRLLFEYSPMFLLLCAGIGLGYGYILYKAKHPWGENVNRMLFAFRSILVVLIAALLIGPILKITQNQTENPELVVLMDNSLSIHDAVDSLKRQEIQTKLNSISGALKSKGFDVRFRDLSGNESSGKFDYRSTDLAGSLRQISDDHEGKNLAGIVLVSDGIYNSGSSPLYVPIRVPVYTIGLGDTAQRTDLILKNLEYNKIAYQGNKFPLNAEVRVDNLPNQNVIISVSQGGKVVNSQTKNTGLHNLIKFDFLLDAKEKGLQRIDVMIQPINAERNKKNNRATAFVEVVEGKKKILMIAPAPHPDIKALRAVAEKNSNYEFLIHIPGVQETDPAMLLPGKADLIIFHQVMDIQSKTATLFNKLSKGPSSLLLIAGTTSNLRTFSTLPIPITFDRPGQWDEATPVINSTFRDFGFSDNINAAFSKYPPVAVPFGRFGFPPDASVLLFQQIGSVATDRPLVLTMDINGNKTGLIMGEGIWRWRMNEYSESEKTEAFDEVFGKLIQYLSTRDDKRKFKVFPVLPEFTDAEPVIFDGQVYNDLFEQVYGSTITIDLQDEQNHKTSYNYVTSPGATRYRIGSLREGVYHFTGSATIEGKKEITKGEFLVRAQNIESQNLTADFGLLRKLAAATGGKFYNAEELAGAEKDLAVIPAKGLIHSEDTFNPMINLAWVFFTLLLLVSVEWFLRKFLGAY